MNTADLADLWDLDETDQRILVAANRAPRLELRQRLAIAGTGTYVIHYQGPHPNYRDEANAGGALYVGSAPPRAAAQGAPRKHPSRHRLGH